ncbi:MAG TPA: cytochrome c oxidase assembly protein [Geminicoccaceae bacterium]|nr:cytochrome c oxidase assembly protein [Geminicoccaceae bacterium]
MSDEVRAPLPVVVFALMAAPAQAHAPAAPGLAHAAWIWHADPVVLVPVLVFGLLYAVGTARLWSRAGVGRGVPVRRALACAAGFAVLCGALVAPLDAAAEISFAAHMAQHMLLIVVAAPLIALGNGGVAMLAALPARLRVPLGRAVASPWLRRPRRWLFALPVATAGHGLVVWLWHAPALYEAALADPPVHYLEHLTMFGTAVLFWWSVTTAWWRTPLGHGAGVAALFFTMLHGGLLGILITLAAQPLYSSYAAAALFASLGPLEDQQVAGIVMLSGGFAYLAAALALLALWLAPALRDSSGRAPMGTAPHR